MEIYDILELINKENGSNYKLAVLTKHKDNETLKRVFAMALDKVTYTYSLRKIPEFTPMSGRPISLETALDFLEQQLCTRAITGNDAIDGLQSTLNNLSEENASIITRIIGRDLKVNVGRTTANKVWSKLIVKPPYMRCDIYTVDKTVYDEKKGKDVLKKGTFRNIDFTDGAYIQLKADGRFVAVTVNSGKASFISRSGEEDTFPILEKLFSTLADGIYVGEMLVEGITNRSEGNGLINSSNPPHEKIFIQLWDFISLEEYADGKHKNKNIRRTLYQERFTELKNNVANVLGDNIRLIPSFEVQSVQEALKYVNQWMTDGFEGGILKDKSNIFKDTTSKTQLKLKLVIDAEVRLTGFLEGTPGTKREKTFGSMLFATDDRKVVGRTSGFTDAQLEYFNSRREELIGKVFTVEFNDITKGRNSDTYAFSHPRFIEFRDDKDTTDALERIFEMKDMAMAMKEKK